MSLPGNNTPCSDSRRSQEYVDPSSAEERNKQTKIQAFLPWLQLFSFHLPLHLTVVMLGFYLQYLLGFKLQKSLFKRKKIRTVTHLALCVCYSFCSLYLQPLNHVRVRPCAILPFLFVIKGHSNDSKSSWPWRGSLVCMWTTRAKEAHWNFKSPYSFTILLKRYFWLWKVWQAPWVKSQLGRVVPMCLSLQQCQDFTLLSWGKG